MEILTPKITVWLALSHSTDTGNKAGARWCGQVLAVHASDHTQTADTLISSPLRSHLRPVWTVHYRQTNLVQHPRTSQTLQLCDSRFQMPTKNWIKVNHSRPNGADIKMTIDDENHVFTHSRLITACPRVFCVGSRPTRKHKRMDIISHIILYGYFYTVSPKKFTLFYLCGNFPNCKPIQIIYFGRKKNEKIWNRLTCANFNIYSLCVASLHRKMTPIFLLIR